jgi:hypothetical protein
VEAVQGVDGVFLVYVEIVQGPGFGRVVYLVWTWGRA